MITVGWWMVSLTGCWQAEYAGAVLACTSKQAAATQYQEELLSEMGAKPDSGVPLILLILHGQCVRTGLINFR